MTADGTNMNADANIHKQPPLPTEFVDAHHHFLDTKKNEFQSFLASLLPNESYLPQEFEEQVVKPLADAGVRLIGSVHVECIPDDGLKEAIWIDSMEDSTVSAIVASCDLTSFTVDQDLAQLKQASPKVRGVRWILDCVGPFEPNTATHVATKRHDGIDYLRGSQGGYDASAVPEFERGFALLAKHDLTFDLQCAPVQLAEAAKLCARHPNVKVVIDHLGKPRMLLGPDESSNINTVPDAQELAIWRRNMALMAAFPQVYVKISMLGYAVPGWKRTPERVELMRQLVRETVGLFGPNRCMVALNWYKDAATSDGDGMSDVGPDPVEFLEYISSFLQDYSDEDRRRLFAGTAREFYRF
jgi:predicted TIM-barrel fold metal-dependent hydrolase